MCSGCSASRTDPLATFEFALGTFGERFAGMLHNFRAPLHLMWQGLRLPLIDLPQHLPATRALLDEVAPGGECHQEVDVLMTPICRLWQRVVALCDGTCRAQGGEGAAGL